MRVENCLLLSWIPGRDYYLGATGGTRTGTSSSPFGWPHPGGEVGGKTGVAPIAAADLSGSLPVLVPMLGGAAQLDVKIVCDIAV